MAIRFASQKEINNWNNLILSNPDGGNINQGIELSTLKLDTGWKIRFIITDICAITIHERFIFGFGKLWYIPKGPGVNTPKEISKLMTPLRKFASNNGVFLLKIEPEILKTSENVTKLSKQQIIPSGLIQPNSSTIVLDLTKSIDDIMTTLPQKSRHAIKRAYRDGIETMIVEPNTKNFNIMASLMNQTMADKSVVMRSDEYYKKYWKLYSEKGLGALFFAYQDGVPVAGAFVLVFGKKGTYKDGGSVRMRTIYGASHALQWFIIEWLHEKGITSYDLCGTPPAAEIGNKNHRFYGIGLFKTSFNKIITEYVGVYDIVVRPINYKIWKLIGERITRRYYSYVRHELFY